MTKLRTLYRPLGDTKQAIRLLTLNPGTGSDPLVACLEEVNLDNVRGQYTALSYVWGRPGRQKELDLGNARVHIGGSLFLALQSLRSCDTPTVVWADAICINQEDIHEKNIQVMLMTRIYQEAKMVHAWLGEETKPSRAKMISTPAVDGWVSFFMASIKCLKQGISGHKKKMIQPSRAGIEVISFLTGNQPFDDKSPWNLMTADEIALGLKDILQRPYFSRIWVVQEAALGKAVKMQVGETAFEWGGHEVTRRFLARIKLLEISPAWQKNKKLESIDMRPLRELLEQTVAHMDKLAGVSPHATLLDIVHQMRHRQSTDQRDKIFGLLGLALPAEIAGFVPDYSESWEVTYERFYNHALSTVLQGPGREWQTDQEFK